MKSHPQGVTAHDPAEDSNKPSPMSWLGRSPIAIVAHGCPVTQDDHLIGLQSAVARCVGVLIAFEIPRLRMPRLARSASLLRQLF